MNMNTIEMMYDDLTWYEPKGHHAMAFVRTKLLLGHLP